MFCARAALAMPATGYNVSPTLAMPSVMTTKMRGTLGRASVTIMFVA